MSTHCRTIFLARPGTTGAIVVPPTPITPPTNFIIVPLGVVNSGTANASWTLVT